MQHFFFEILVLVVDMKPTRLQVLLFFCCFLLVCGCLFLLQSRPGLWTTSTDFKTLEDSKIFQRPFSKEIERKPMSFKGRFQEPMQVNVSYLAELLQDRLALPNDALKFIYQSPCKEHENDGQPCMKENCSALSNKPLQERIEDLVLAPQLQLSDRDLQKILSIVSVVPEADVIIGSASSSNHFKEMQAMFEGLQRTVFPTLKNFRVVLFDIGLKKRQRRLTEKYCKCQVLSFPFKLFPPHVSELRCYSWKPIIIRALINKARKLFIWQDNSVRYTKEYSVILKRAMLYGHQFIENTKSARITAHTHPQMFAYMGEETCQYYNYREIQCGFQVMKKDPLIVQAVLNPWTRCALEKSCMCPVDPKDVIYCPKHFNSTLPSCHRFDQSAMSIILSKLYGADRYRIIVPDYSRHSSKYVSIKRGDKLDNFFSRQRKAV